jgi:hypothetical protein
MSSEKALQLIIAVSVLLFFTRPITGLMMDAFKVMLRVAVTGLVLQVIPLDFIDNWSKLGAGWAHVSAVYVPVICLIALVALSTANLIFLSGTTAEQIIRIVLYVVGGVFAVGSPQWIAWEGSVGSLVGGVLGIIVNAAKIFAEVLPS